MARVTVEDCVLIVPNRFDLVITAAARAKQISSGMPLTIDRDNDKDSVVSLREIADKTIDVKLVQEEMLANFQKKSGFDSSDVIEDDAHGAAYALDAAMDPALAPNPTQYLEAGQGMSFVEENIEVED